MHHDTVSREPLCLLGRGVRASNAEAHLLGRHWQAFLADGVREQIDPRLDDAIVALYCEYEGDHESPYTFFLGCRVAPTAGLQEGLERREVPGGLFARVLAEGEQPLALIEAWRQIWEMPLLRRFESDYEIHDPANPRCVEIFVGVD